MVTRKFFIVADNLVLVLGRSKAEDLVAGARRALGAEPERWSALMLVSQSFGAAGAILVRDPGVARLRLPDGQSDLDIGMAGSLRDLTMTIRQMPAAGQARLMRWLLGDAAARLKLFDDPGFIRFAAALVTRLLPKLPLATLAVDLDSDFTYVRLDRLAEIGANATVAVLTSTTLRRNPFDLNQVVRGESTTREIVLHRAGAPVAPNRILLVFGDRGWGTALVRGDRLSEPPALVRLLKSDADGARQSLQYLARCFQHYIAARPGIAALLREMAARLPARQVRLVAAGSPVCATIEVAAVTPKGGVFLKALLSDPQGITADLLTPRPFGPPISWPSLAARVARPDAAAMLRGCGPAHAGTARPGLVAFAADAAVPPVGGRVPVLLRYASGIDADLSPASAVTDPFEARDQVLRAVEPAAVDDALIAGVLAPAVAAFHAACAPTAPPRRIEIGRPPASPTCSVVIPLYRNLDFLRLQLAAFAADRDFSDAEIILVLDSPEQEDWLIRFLRGLLPVYGVPVVLLVHARNYGYAQAVNAGCRAARAPWLMLLNSDVVPDEPGWLGAMLATAARPDCGIVGPMMLFEDDSIQHAGMYFDRDAQGRWYNRHYFKGFPRRFAAAAAPRSVPAVTGACMLLERTLFEAVGGLTTDYVHGDYEDSDLCLKIAATGRRHFYAPNAVLYHFERQSIQAHSGYQESAACQYNRWLHQQRWDGAMTDAMREAGEADTVRIEAESPATVSGS